MKQRETNLDIELVKYYGKIEESLKKGEKIPSFKRTIKTGRNEFCPCKSGKKFKKCCMDNIR